VTLAESLLKPGLASIEHYHAKTEEIYYFTQGSGSMSLNGKMFRVKKGDGVLIPPGTRHRMENTGRTDLKLLCACAPPYSHNDTFNVRYNFKLMIFDFDGTLVKSAPGIHATANVMAKFYGTGPVSLEHVEQTLGTGLDDFIKRTFPEVLKTHSMAEIMKKNLEIYDHEYKRGLKIFAGVRKTLQALHKKGIKLAIVSNKFSKYVNGINKELLIDRYFDTVLGSENVKKMKPDPYPLNLLMKKYGVDKSETLMVGDSQYDVEAGKRAGVFTYFLTYGYADIKKVRKNNPDFIENNLKKILKLI
jgi:phosphoglycolate phosphatase